MKKVLVSIISLLIILKISFCFGNKDINFSNEDTEVDVSKESELEDALESDNIKVINLISNIQCSSSKNVTNKEVTINLNGYSIEFDALIEYGFLVSDSNLTVIASSTSDDMYILGTSSSLFNVISSNLTIESTSNKTLFIGAKTSSLEEITPYIGIYGETSSKIKLTGKIEVHARPYSMLFFYDVSVSINGEDKGIIISSPISIYSNCDLSMTGSINASDLVDAYYNSNLEIIGETELISIGNDEAQFGIMAYSSNVYIKGNVKVYGYYNTIDIFEDSKLTLEGQGIYIYSNITSMFTYKSKVIINADDEGSGINIGEKDKNQYGLVVNNSTVEINGIFNFYGKTNALAYYDETSLISFKNYSKISFTGENYNTYIVFNRDDENNLYIGDPSLFTDKCEIESVKIKSDEDSETYDREYSLMLDSSIYCANKKEKIIGSKTTSSLNENVFLFYDNSNNVQLKLYNLLSNKGTVTQISNGNINNIYILSDVYPNNFILYDNQIVNFNFNDEVVEGMNSIYVQDKNDESINATISDIQLSETIYQITLNYENHKNLIGDFDITINFEDSKNSIVLMKEQFNLIISEFSLTKINLVNTSLGKEFIYEYSDSNNSFILQKTTSINKIILTFNEENLIKGSYTLQNSKDYSLDTYITGNQLYIINNYIDEYPINDDMEFTITYSYGNIINTYKFNLKFFELTNISPSIYVLTSSQKNISLTFDVELTNINHFELIDEKTKIAQKKIYSFNYVTKSSKEHIYSFLIKRIDYLYGTYLVKIVFNNIEFTSEKSLRIDQYLPIQSLIVNDKLNFQIPPGNNNFSVPFLTGHSINKLTIVFTGEVISERYEISNNQNYTFTTEYSTIDKKRIVITLNNNIQFNVDNLQFKLADTLIENEQLLFNINSLKIMSVNPVKLNLKKKESKIVVIQYSTKLYNLKEIKLINKEDETQSYSYQLIYIKETISGNTFNYSLYVNEEDLDKAKYKISTIFSNDELNFESPSDIYIEIDKNTKIIDNSLKVFLIAVGVFIIVFTIISVILWRIHKKRTQEYEQVEKLSFVDKGPITEKMSYNSNTDLL